VSSSKVTVAEQHLALQQAIAQLLADSPEQCDAGRRILETIGEWLGWPLGMFWQLDEPARRLRCVDAWHSPAAGASELESASRMRYLSPGEGLPGSVWQSGAPVRLR
jgi:hypothetical protein